MELQYHYQQCKVQINHNRFLGYMKDAEGNHEAIIPKDIYLQVHEELVLQDAVVKAINQILRAKKPMTRLPMKSSGFENSASRPP